jgi:DNA-binding CsgD family transcriptional regulator
MSTALKNHLPDESVLVQERVESLLDRRSSVESVKSADEEAESPSGHYRVRSAVALTPQSHGRTGWTVLEEFEFDGYSYRVQRRPIEVRGPVSLAPREREAVGLACAGLSRKQIASELGLAPSTVGVLLHRAAQKLQATNRPELLQSYRATQSTLGDDV